MAVAMRSQPGCASEASTAPCTIRVSCPPTRSTETPGYYAAAYPVAARMADEVLSLPVHHLLTQSDLEEIVSAVNAWAESISPVATIPCRD